MSKLKIYLGGIFALLLCSLVVFLVLVLIYAYSVLTVLLSILGVYLLNVVFAFYLLNSKKRTSLVKVSWIFAMVVLPLIGPIMFVIFGMNPIKTKKRTCYNEAQKDLVSYENYDFSKQFVKSADNNIFNYALVNSLRPIYQNNNVRHIYDSCDIYQESIELIRSAKKFINVEFYILNDGFFLRVFLTELIKKAQQGIKIRLLYDWFGCPKERFSRSMIKELEKAGIEVAIFNPKGINRFKGATNFRIHRKYIIVDNEKVFYGGSNIGDEYLSMSKAYNSWSDYNCIIQGQIVNTLNILFSSDWLNFTDYTLSKQQREEYKKDFDFLFHQSKKQYGSFVAQAIEYNVDYDLRSLKDIHLDLIYHAKKTIKIVTPYFMPTEDLAEAITTAHNKGVNVEIITPGENDDKKFVKLMNRNGFQKLIDKQIKIFEYDGFMHSKYMLIDDQLVIFGSCNMDFRSFYLNFESCILTKSKDFNENLTELFEKTKINSKQITKTEIQGLKKIKTRIIISLLNIIYPLL